MNALSTVMYQLFARRLMLNICVVFLLFGALVNNASATTFTLRIGAGHPSAPVPYVRLTEHFFVPEVTKRVQERTKHKVKFVQAYGGTIAKLNDVLEATEKGLLDIGHVCFCFEPSKAFAQNLNYYIPFSTPSAVKQLAIMKQIYTLYPKLATHFNKYNQTMIALTGYDNYGLGTTFAWDDISQLKSHKLGGAGPNLPWLELTGATVVRSNLNEGYTALQTGIYDGVLIFPLSYYGLKNYEVAPHYKVVDLGAVMVNGMMINNKTMRKLPAEVIAIIKEVAAEYEIKVAEALDESQKMGLSKLEKAGTQVTRLSFKQKQAWAQLLAQWPNEMAQKVNGMGYDGTGIFNTYMKLLEDTGYKFPIRYVIK